VNILSSSGHTPGHQCIVVSSGTERAIILGDLVHCSMQFAEPDVTFMFDVDPVLAKKVRDELAAKLCADKSLVGACHFSGSVFGRVVTGEG
jgi:glyoxylase-like metal-dependent hydrolase (beta-lactamase superfamily II)